MLRVEDTDQTRLVEGSVENLLLVLASVGLIPDEGPNNPGDKGPYFQSERLDIYNEHIKTLLEKDKAYHCFCSSDRLTELRAEQQDLWLPTRYNQNCRFMEASEVQKKLDEWASHTIRLKVPKNQKVSFVDIIRGKIEIDTKDIDDQVLMKSDGFPTYHMAVIVDDHLMEVTHVIRWEEWVPSTPKHVLIYEAFGWEQPVFAHLPLLLWKSKKKLSKREWDVSVESFLEKWYLPEAILNYISLLGWNPKTTEEIFSMNELIERFELKDVHKSGAVFEEERLEWFNTKYMSSMDTETLYNKLMTYLRRYDNDFKEFLENQDQEYVKIILTELKTRLRRLSEFKELTDFFFETPTDTDNELLINAKMKIPDLETVKKWLELSKSILEKQKWDFESIDEIKEIFITEIKAAEMKNGQVLWPVRVALSMKKFSPGALELLYILWREKSIERISKVLKDIS